MPGSVDTASLRILNDMRNWQRPNQSKRVKRILYSIDCFLVSFFILQSFAFGSGTNTHKCVYLSDPDAVSLFLFQSQSSCVNLFMWITWCIVHCRHTRTHAHIDYSGFTLAFNSNQYIIYTMYKFLLDYMRWTLAFYFSINTHTDRHRHILHEHDSAFEPLRAYMLNCSFSASTYPFGHNWCCY